MTLQSVENVLDALINDKQFRRSFEEDRKSVIASLGVHPDLQQALLDLDVNALIEGGASVKDNVLRGAHV